MSGNGFLLFALAVAAVGFGAYFSLAPLERWQKRLKHDLERLRSGASKAEDATRKQDREPERY